MKVKYWILLIKKIWLYNKIILIIIKFQELNHNIRVEIQNNMLEKIVAKVLKIQMIRIKI